MAFDIPTLAMAVALATAFCAGARILLWRMHPAIPGLGRWALASVIAALGLALIFSDALHGQMPALALAQLAFGLGMLLSWDGFRRFAGRPGLSSSAWIALLALLVALAGAAQFEQSLRAHGLTNALAMGIFSALIARELFTAARPIQIAMRAAGWIYAANAAFFLARAVILTEHVGAGGHLDPDGLAAFVLLWALGMTIAITLGMVLMTTERLQTDLDAQVHRDPLTGALNRRAFALIAANEITRAQRGATPLSLLMIDLDHFKRINDQYGHERGDALLCHFVDVAKRILRGQDIFCRFGGEEFVALLPDTTADRGLRAAERLRLGLSQRSDEDNELAAIPLTISIGIGQLQPGEDIESLLRRADTALYRAKDLGRDRSELADAHEESAGHPTPVPDPSAIEG